jgi:transposase
MGIKMRLVLYATSGRDQSTVAEFVKDLQEHGGDSAAVSAVTMDMPPAFVFGVEAHLPQTVISFDRLHVTKSVNDAVDQVRLEEQKAERDLKRNRYLWLKNWDHLSEGQQDRLELLLHKPLKTSRAHLVNGSLQGLWDQPEEITEPYSRR